MSDIERIIATANECMEGGDNVEHADVHALIAEIRRLQTEIATIQQDLNDLTYAGPDGRGTP